MEDRFRKDLHINGGIIVGSIMMFAVALFFVARFTASQSKAIVENRVAIASNRTALDSYSGLKASAVEAAQITKNLNALLPPQDRLLDISKFLEGIARVYNLGTTFSFQGEATQPTDVDPGYVPFTMFVTGTSDQIKQFLIDVEEKSARFILAFDAVDLSAVGGGYRADVRGRVFFR